MNELNLIETMSQRQILYSTYWDVMDSETREKVFQAYDYDSSKEVYKLKHPEILTPDIIKKLIEYDGF